MAADHALDLLEGFHRISPQDFDDECIRVLCLDVPKGEGDCREVP